jgi:hypothetical protein
VDVDLIETASAKKKKKCDPAVDETCGLLRSLFFFNVWLLHVRECVANKVRDLNASRLQSFIQQTIRTIMLEAEMDLHSVQIHNEHTQLPVHFDSEPTSASCTVTSTSTPQSSSTSI